MLAAITGLLSSLPELLKLATNLWAWIQKVSGGDAAGFIIKTNEAFKKLNDAKTDEEIAEAARAIQAAIKGTR